MTPALSTCTLHSFENLKEKVLNYYEEKCM
jgi:hypothetical protein